MNTNAIKRADAVRDSVRTVLNGRGYGGESSEGYMGATRWDGNKHQHLWGAELSRTLQNDLRDVLGDMGVKRSHVSVSCKTYSGGQHVTVKVKAPIADVVMPYDKYAEMNRFALDRETWPTVGTRTYSHEELMALGSVQPLDDLREQYCAEQWARLASMQRIEADGGHWDGERLTDWALAVSCAAHCVLDAYNHDDTNTMVDYFDRGFYQNVYFVAC